MEMRSIYAFMVGNLQGKRSLGTYVYRWEIVVKLDLVEKGVKM
jgi:hypothetical protein